MPSQMPVRVLAPELGANGTQPVSSTTVSSRQSSSCVCGRGLCLSLLIVVAVVVWTGGFAMGVASSIRFSDDCFSGCIKACDIPSCHCGQSIQSSQCMTRPQFEAMYKQAGEYSSRYSRRWCSLAAYTTYERTGGDAYTWTIACISCALAVCSVCVTVAYAILVIGCSTPDALTESQQDAAAWTFPFLVAPCCAGSVIIGVILLIGVVVARKPVNGVIYPAKVVQYVMYTSLFAGAAAGIYASVLHCASVSPECNRDCCHCDIPITPPPPRPTWQPRVRSGSLSSARRQQRQ